MSVYVDPPAHWAHMRQWPGDLSSHMIASDEGELHRMAQRIGAPAPTLFSRTLGPHYDLTTHHYAAALGAGAIPVSHAGMIARRAVLFLGGKLP